MIGAGYTGRRQWSTLREGLFLTGIVAVFCAFAFLASDVQCGSTDGTFSLDDGSAQPSGYCQLTHFPGIPDTVGSWLFVAAVYLAPIAIALGGTVAAARTGDRRFLGIGIALAAVAALALLVMSFALSHVGYAGAG